MPDSRLRKAEAVRQRSTRVPSRHASSSWPCRLRGCRNRRLGGRPRRLQKARERAASQQRHGLHPGPASRSDPRKHDGGPAGRPHVDDRAAGNRWNADRARPPLCHSPRNLSLRRQWRAASVATSGASRRAPAVRFPAALAGGGLRRARHLRDPFGNRGRRQPWAESREGKRRVRHRAGSRRGRL